MSSYKQIAKSSGLIAFVSIFQMVFGLLRNKIIAVLLGAKGFGIYGLFQVFVETAITFASLGLDKSGVRQIARYGDSTVDRDRCIAVFFRGLLVTSVFTALICIVFSKAISQSLFNTEDYYVGIILASGAVILRSISQGQISILNGIRDLRGLALSQILAAVIGSILSVVFIVFMGLDGIVLSFVSFGLASLLFSYYFVRKQKIQKVTYTRTEFFTEFRLLIYLGLGFSVSAAIASFFTFLSRSYIGSFFDIEVVGIYQACWLISNMYIGIILTAMGVDFMPRLMKSIDDVVKVRKMVNEQMELGALLSGVGVIFIILFSEILLILLYSSEFSAGSSIIRWQVLGVSLRVLGFPLAHSVMAFKKPVWYALIQSVFALIEYLFLILFTKYYGFDGLGISYFAGYIIFMLMWYVATRKLFKFSFSKKLIYILVLNWTGIIVAILLTRFLNGVYLYVLGILFLIIYIGVVSKIMERFMRLSVISLIKNKISKKK